MKAKFSIAAAVAAMFMSAQAQAQFSDGKIKIGVLTDLSGLYTDNTGLGSVLAAQMAVEDAGGKIGNTPVELISADHQNKADVGAAVARRWYDIDQVDLILDVPNSAVALATQAIAREKNRMVIFSSPAASDLTGKACSPVGAHWTYDTYALSQVIGRAVVANGFKNWFFLTADYAFGHTLEAETSAVVKSVGGQVAGAVRAPANTADFSSFLLQAQASKAQVIGLATAGADTQNAIKQAAEFGVTQSGQKLATLLLAINEVHALGLKATSGIMLASPFYWDLDDDTRAFSKRFFARHKAMPSLYQAGVYSAVAHYLKGVKAANSDSAAPVMAKMRELPIDDFMTKGGKLRADGRVVRDMYLFEVKSPEESKAPWDYYKMVRKVPGDEAFRPLAGSPCPLVSN
ncbi:ABC transporter substrate-binding protein [Bosea sp. (in: a-proteobacteria)]|jgi:branched-chain amino acid transport system substrate-binding protein|uniref:ABC transporter substrate-binding protein n=1 Tax=Bosea sp. (in: a-proteobacteria) TaxID=1871050 RepID=UPI002DDDA874|nr:ABC transporter substrate-binding protein [Bosea sp. (in: a-proteobacteria)]HEV2510297.1 ABC transporter substrate-binding protein [Bosea sp. (in: a-proteobacteria)]